MAMALKLDQKVFQETQGAIVRGEYSTPNGPRKFFASRAAMEDVDYYSAEDVDDLIKQAESKLAGAPGESCAVEVCEEDSLVAALRIKECRADAGEQGALPVLVLNFANAYEAGGNVYIGPHAQEGELCRRSTVFASISSIESRPYYDANTDLGGNLHTDGVLLSPHVEVFRKVGYLTMDEPVVVSVISSPAPYAKALVDVSSDELFDVLKHRIMGFLAVAADAGYKHLVLGAWGCGTNGNDPALMARAFHEALDAFGPLFDTVVFAIAEPFAEKPNLAAFTEELAS